MLGSSKLEGTSMTEATADRSKATRDRSEAITLLESLRARIGADERNITEITRGSLNPRSLRDHAEHVAAECACRYVAVLGLVEELEYSLRSVAALEDALINLKRIVDVYERLK